MLTWRTARQMRVQKEPIFEEVTRIRQDRIWTKQNTDYTRCAEDTLMIYSPKDVQCI